MPDEPTTGIAQTIEAIQPLDGRASASAAALIADAIAPEVGTHLIASHRSTERERRWVLDVGGTVAETGVSDSGAVVEQEA